MATAKTVLWKQIENERTSYPYRVEADRILRVSETNIVKSWCHERLGHYGSKWTGRGSSFQFRNESDMLLFMMTWNGNTIEREAA